MLHIPVYVPCWAGGTTLTSEAASDYKTGFGGQFGVQKDRQDKSAAGWDHVEKVEKHSSQIGNL